MKTPLALLLPLCLLTAALPAHAGIHACNVHSDYSLQIGDDALVFRRGSAELPREVRVAAGRLWLDGIEHDPGGSADGVARFESQARDLIPQLRAIALDGVAIAAEAVTHTLAALGGDAGARMQPRVDAVLRDIESGIDAAFSGGRWDEARFEREVERLLAELVPVIAAEFAGAAVRAALSGDEAGVRELESRARDFEQRIRRDVEASAAALEQRAEIVCAEVRRLHALQVDWRHPDGRALGLLRM